MTQKVVRRIAFVDQAEEYGGAEQSLIELVPQLERTYFEPLVFHSERAQWVYSEELADFPRIPIWKTAGFFGARRDELESGYLAGAGYFATTFKPVQKLRNSLSEYCVDIVHTNALKSHLLGGLAAYLSRRPLVWHVRDIVDQSGALTWLLRGCRLFRPHIIAISRATAAQFASVADKISISVIHNGIPITKFHPGPQPEGLREQLGLKDDDKIVLIVGRLTPWKGHMILLEAMRLVREKCPNARLLVAGETAFWDAQYKETLLNKSRENGVDDITHWLDFRRDIPELLRLCDVFVLPSVNEPFGRAIIEAMATGKPVIGTNSGGVPEIITDKKCGLLVEPKNVSQLAEAIITLLQNSSMAREFGEAGWRRANRHFALHRVAREVMEVYDSL